MSQTATAESAIHYSGELSRKQDSGELVPIATVFYNPKTDLMEFYFPKSITEHEALAMLKTFGCYPRERRKR